MVVNRVISSPNHPTSDIEDAFSSNFPNYISASSDYVPASPGKTYSSSSNNSFGVVPIVSPTLSLFHDDPYMKVMHAYYAKESPIPPPTIISLHYNAISTFNPQEFFLPENYCHLRNTSITNHSPLLYLPTLKNLRWEKVLAQARIAKLQRKKMGNNNKITLARFKIANLEQIIEEIQMPPKRMSTSEAPTMTQAAIWKLVADNVNTALEAQAANMANTD
ncbi:hypothetical protein Tco_0834526 [Tanacetum coccineum]